MGRHPADDNGNDSMSANDSALLAEVSALRHRLAALERLHDHPAKDSRGRKAKPRPSRKTVAWLTTGAVVAMLAGVSAVYGQSAVDAFFISKEGEVSIGRVGALFVSKAGNVGIGTSMPKPDNKLEVNGKIAASSVSATAFATTDKSVTIQGAGGRNLFKDSEGRGNLRVGAAYATPGIYSDDGDVVVASESKNVWLYGKVAISTKPKADERNKPETLYVDGGIKATGTAEVALSHLARRGSVAPSYRYPKPLNLFNPSPAVR